LDRFRTRRVLYASLGDGGSGGDPLGSGQDINSLLGKILRIDVHGDSFSGDASRNYAVPADNPFVGMPGADEIFAFGLRNPWRPSFDRALGDFYIADVGQNQWEEIDLGQIGANYGWNAIEGPAPFPGGGPLISPAVAPIYFYDHTVGHSITGGYVYRGEGEALQGQYFFADFVDNKVFTLRFDGTAWTATERTSQIVPDAGQVNSPASFGEDGLGNLYLVDFDGDIFKLTPNVTSADQADVLRGLGGNDMLFGGSGNDTLDGGAGADVLIGGDGTDTADYSLSAAGVTVSLLTGLGAGGDAQGDTLGGIKNITGSAQADTLTGDGAANTLDGGSGNDTLIGGAGADTLIGGPGTDTASYASSGAGVTVNLQTGSGSGGDAQGDTLSGIENITGSAFADVLTGDGGANTLVGGAGADALNGGGGTDTADYSSSAAAVNVNLLANSGAGGDAAGDTFSSIENIIGSAFADMLRGDTGANTLDGRSGNDTLIGGAGADALIGGAGTDTADYSSSAAGVTVNLLTGSGSGGDAQGDTLSGIENITGSAFADTLTGDGGVNTLAGGLGADVLKGGAGNDTLSGGADNDTFVFDATALTPAQPGSAFFDRILDYNRAEGDLLDFSALISPTHANDATGTLVRVLENPSGTGAILQVDPDGTAGGMNWTTIARLDGVHTGDSVQVVLDSTQPAGVPLTVPQLMPTQNFNGDTHADILWQSSSGMPAAWLMNGTNAVTVSGVGSFNPGPSWHVKGSGDFNGDGKSDILWQDNGGTPAIWLMNGTTAVSVSAAGSFNPGPSWQIKGTGDFNGDGKSDILWQDSGGAAAIWLMDGATATSVAAVGPFNPGPSWQIKGTGDFNGDGKSDILWQGSDGTPAIWLMDGINFVSTSAAGSFNPGPSWQVKGAGDFNGDGKSDILWQGSDGTPAIWLMDGATAVTVSAAGSFNPGPSWHVKGAADFNGDGKSDILWQGSDGTPAIWLMDGTHAVSVSAAGSFNPGTMWDVIV
jgi:Ca2+-binding RTX toxin-like protein